MGRSVNQNNVLIKETGLKVGSFVGFFHQNIPIANIIPMSMVQSMYTQHSSCEFEFEFLLIYLNKSIHFVDKVAQQFQASTHNATRAP